MKLKTVKCPHCGREQEIKYNPDAKCQGVFVECEEVNCKKEFEIKINQDK